jgi:hypothetical protein
MDSLNIEYHSFSLVIQRNEQDVNTLKQLEHAPHSRALRRFVFLIRDRLVLLLQLLPQIMFG